jgi:hypothetical protein
VDVTGSRGFRSGHYDVTGSDGAGQYNVTVSGGRGVYIGDHGIQVNLFTGEPPPGPAVAGNVPQAPRAFRPREDLMVRLRSAGPGVPVVRAVTGMRGVGKTQLAAAYARERIDAGWRLVAWVSAEDTPAILNGLAVVAARLGMDRPGVALEIVGAEVRNRLEADGDRCLIVFDNVTDPDAVRPYLPSAGHAQAVITSTDISTAGLGAPRRWTAPTSPPAPFGPPAPTCPLPACPLPARLPACPTCPPAPFGPLAPCPCPLPLALPLPLPLPTTSTAPSYQF